MNNSIIESLKRSLRRPTFLAAVLVLLVAAVGLNASVRFMQLHFKKLPVDLAHPLTTIPEQLGPWVQVSPNQTLDPEMQDVLGTDKYVFRDYVDTRVAGANIAARFKDKTAAERQQLLFAIRSERPEAVVNLAVTYYTGMVDTVAHVPDRCYIADGFEPSIYKEEGWKIRRPLGAAAGALEPVTVRYISFEDQTRSGSTKRNVAYFFKVNDHFECSPLGVRRTMQNLLEKYGYYAKVETMTSMSDSDASARVITDFLTYAMPEIEKCLPDWEKLHQAAAK